MTGTFRWVLLAALASGLATPLDSHETNFGISPSTLHKGGVHLESNIIWDRKTEIHRGDDRVSDRAGRHRTIYRQDTLVHYGVTPTVTVGLQLPWMRIEEGETGRRDRSESGLNDMTADVKFRFYKKDTFAGTHYASVIAAYTFGGPKTGRPALDDGADAYLLGAGTSFVRPVFSFWLNGALRWHDKESGSRAGTEVIASTALGYRPWIAERDEIELNYMLEFNYEHQERAHDRAGEIGSSGREVVFVSPGLRVNYNRQLIKGGVQIPLEQSWHGTQLDYGPRFKLGWEWMF